MNIFNNKPNCTNKLIMKKWWSVSLTEYTLWGKEKHNPLLTWSPVFLLSAFDLKNVRVQEKNYHPLDAGKLIRNPFGLGTYHLLPTRASGCLSFSRWHKTHHHGLSHSQPPLWQVVTSCRRKFWNRGTQLLHRQLCLQAAVAHETTAGSPMCNK